MPTPEKLFARKLQSRLSQKQDDLPRFPATIGDGFGNVYFGSSRTAVHVRIGNQLSTAICTRVQPVDGMSVWVGYANEERTIYQVLSQRTIDASNANNLGGYAPANRYRYLAKGGGQDPLFLELRAWLPLRVGMTSPPSLSVSVYEGNIYTGTAVVFVSSQNIYLTTHVPATAGKAAWVLISVDDTGAIVDTKGTEVDIADLAPTGDIFAEMPAIPTGTVELLALVRVYEGQTAIREGRATLSGDGSGFTDFIDLRGIYSIGGGGGGTWGSITGTLSSQTDLQSALDAKLDDSQLDTDGTLAANSDTKLASQKAVKTYVDNASSNASVIAKVLTGFTSGAGTVTASDSILSAFQKVVGNIALKLTANSPITGATKTKITYDANGLVTAGADLSASDIPNLDASKITSGTMATARLGSGTAGSTNFLRGDQTWATPSSGGDWTLITDTVLGASAANFDLTSIPGTYKHLRLDYSLRSDRAGFASDRIKVVINNDTASNKYESILYYWFHPSTWATTTIGSTTFAEASFVCAATALANSFGGGFIDFPDYTASKLKLFQTRGGQMQSTTIKPEIYDGMAVWRDTAAITRITISPEFGTNWVAGSRVTLYGKK